MKQSDKFANEMLRLILESRAKLRETQELEKGNNASTTLYVLEFSDHTTITSQQVAELIGGKLPY